MRCPSTKVDGYTPALADAMLERFGADTLDDIRDAMARADARVQQRFHPAPADA
jgi:hypothetical protein